MKKIFFYITGLILVAACQHDVIYEVDYNVTLNGENTYYAGEPVKFNISGEVDNILFYSGEQGHQYKYKDRYSVPVEGVKSATLSIDFQPQWGYQGGLDVYVSNTFEGLNGNDAAADKAAIQAMVDGEMEGWTKLEWDDPKNANDKPWISDTYDVSSLAAHACFAFHWHPTNDGKSAQRSYAVNGAIKVELDGAPDVSTTLRDFSFVTVMMNEQIDNPYVKNGDKGTISFIKDAGHIFFQGYGKGVVDYGLDGWAFSVPQPLNKVANDKGVVIKNLQNYLHSYEYTWTEPGTYEVAFVGRNENYAHSSEQVVKYKISIVEKTAE